VNTHDEVSQLKKLQSAAELAESDAAAANLAILQGYFGLSNSLGRFLHGDDGVVENATFPTFAAWSAVSLRADVVGRADRKKGFAEPRRLGHRVYRRLAEEWLGRGDLIARNIARGEGTIYEEIGSALQILLDLDRADDSYTPELWDVYTDRLKHVSKDLNRNRHSRGQPETVAEGDVAKLQYAVKPYFKLLSEGLSRRDLKAAGKKRRAELILQANVRLVAYEQRRLQPVLERNFAYVPDALRAKFGILLTRPRPLISALRRAQEPARTATAMFDEAFEIAATRHVFSAVVGGEELKFGRDLPFPPPANSFLRDRQPESDKQRYSSGSFFPDDLQTLEDRGVFAAWQQYDRSSGEGHRTAVHSWLRYGERLNFIVNMFRSRQQLTALYDTRWFAPSAVPAPLGTDSHRLSDATKKRLADSFGESS
jgi:hypothetical protein